MAQVLEKKTRHSTRRRRVLGAEIRRRPSEWSVRAVFGSSSSRLLELVRFRVGWTPLTTIRALWECETIQVVWNLHFEWVDRTQTFGFSFDELINFIRVKPQLMDLFATTAWYIW